MTVAEFLESISLLDTPNGIKPETALAEGHRDYFIVLAALEQGHPCLQRSVYSGQAPRTFLQLVRETMGMSKFLSAQLPTVHPRVFVGFISEYLYPEPSETPITDDELRCNGDRWTDEKGRLHKILANRKDRRAA